MTQAPERLATALSERYRVERPLGQGGMATVYLVHDLKHGRDVALKVLRPELGAVLGSERFLAEIRITARLDHPHILTLIDSGVVDGYVYYVLPLVRGESLRAKLDREKQLGVDEALAITRQVASALDYAHRQGVIHRDIKPENILLQEGEAVLTDFGIALAVTEAGGNRLTETGLSLGTPQYMSPEQATGDRALDARSDIYSLGAVLYEILAGEPPVTGPNAQAMIAKLMTERPVRLAVVRDAVPPAIDAAVARALSKVPADRFATAGEFVRALVGPATAASAGAKTRPRWVVTAGIGIVAVALGVAAWAQLRGRQPVVSEFTPQYDQLTTDGNARAPALSPDGTRLAFVARDCDERAHCVDRLVVRDIGSAASITVLRGGSIRNPGWTSDGRFLMAGVTDSSGAHDDVAVSALGGPVRPLRGWGSGIVGSTDTVIVGPGNLAADDSVAWLRVVTASDGLVRDSIRVTQPGPFQVAYPAPRGGRIAFISYRLTGTVVRLLDRSGRTTDSLPTFTNTLRSLRWTPQADALVLQIDLREGSLPFASAGAASVPSILVRWRVDVGGRFGGRPDTLMRMERGSQIAELRRDGSAVLSQGPVEAIVYALERNGVGRVDFRARRLTSSTAGLRALLSRDGKTVWLQHGGTGSGSGPRNAFVPFEGGPERPFNLPSGAEISADWTRPVSTSLLYAVRDSSGRARLVSIDVATGQSRAVLEIPPRTSFVFAIAGGGYGIGDVAIHSTRAVGRPGKPDTVWSVAGIPGRRITTPGEASSDGRAFFEFSQSARGDTVWVRRVPIDRVDNNTLPAVPVVFEQWLGTLLDGSIEAIRSDEPGSLGWYRTPAGGGRAVRLGDAPVPGAQTTWSGSEDGLRFIAVKPVERPDIFVLRNFAELLRR